MVFTRQTVFDKANAAISELNEAEIERRIMQYDERKNLFTLVSVGGWSDAQIELVKAAAKMIDRSADVDREKTSDEVRRSFGEKIRITFSTDYTELPIVDLRKNLKTIAAGLHRGLHPIDEKSYVMARTAELATLDMPAFLNDILNTATYRYQMRKQFREGIRQPSSKEEEAYDPNEPAATYMFRIPEPGVMIDDRPATELDDDEFQQYQNIFRANKRIVPEQADMFAYATMNTAAATALREAFGPDPLKESARDR